MLSEVEERKTTVSYLHSSPLPSRELTRSADLDAAFRKG
jgi:hypothetical protein